MKRVVHACTLLPVLLLNAACSSPADDRDRAALEAEVLEWRDGRRAALMAPTGFLTLAGLFWLEGDIATFGSAINKPVPAEICFAPRCRS